MEYFYSDPLNYNPIQEAKDETRHFEIKPLDPDKLIKINDLKEITNPTFFNGDNTPTKDGLLSNEIFGLTKEDRGNTFAYISLNEYFFNPIFYKIWSRMDSHIKEIVHEVKKFRIDEKGNFIEDENGKTGIKFIRDNINKINIKTTESKKRDRNIEFLKNNLDTMFIKNFIVIPAYYRDIKTSNGYVGVGEINKLYSNLIVAVRALKDSREYGLHITGATRGRIQEILLQIYNWFSTGATSTGGKDGVGIAGKFGIMRRANLNKTTDYSSRLVLSAPNLKCENLDDLMVDLDYCGLPLASACVNFYPYILYNVRRFFENEFSNKIYYDYFDKSGKLQRCKLKDYQINFSDERIKKELDRYIHGFSNRLIPIEVPNEENKKIYMRFKGRTLTPQEVKNNDIDIQNTLDSNRYLTWCDVFFIAAVESSEDKNVLITRYPMDSYFNQFVQKVRITTTKETEPVIINGKVYKWYPKIRQTDIGSNTSNMFIDTLTMQNAHLKKIGGDYDGDQVTVKPLYTVEANKECEEHLKSKSNYISLGGSNIKKTTNEGSQVLYNLTLSLSDKSNLQEPKFKK